MQRADRERASGDLDHIPVVALSANAMPRDIEKGLDVGFFRYLTKPIKVKEFMDTLNAALAVAGANDRSRQVMPDKILSHARR